MAASKSLTPLALRLDPELANEARAYAKATGRTFTGLVVLALRQFMASNPLPKK